MCMELGCFLAGLVVSSQSKEFCEKVDSACNQRLRLCLVTNV